MRRTIITMSLSLACVATLACDKQADAAPKQEAPDVEQVKASLKEELKQEMADEAAKAAEAEREREAAERKKEEEAQAKREAELLALRGHCKEGRAAKGDAPPKAHERWCEIADAEGRPSGVKDGVYESWHANGNVKEVVQYVDGNADGPSVHYHDNGNKESAGEMKAGNMVGAWETFMPDGKPLTRVHYNDQGQLHGDSITYFASGLPNVKHTYENGLAHGAYIEYWESNGRIAREGTYVSGNPDGIWTRYDEAGGEVGKESYVGGVMQAIVCEGGATTGEEKTADGVEKYCMVAGKKEGPAEETSTAGNLLRQGEYRAGRKEGVWTMYWDTPGTPKKRAETAYVKGQREGWFTGYHDDGTIIRKQGQHRGGKPDGVWTEYHANGNREAQGARYDGDMEGVWTFWYESGEKKEEVEFVANKRSGSGVLYHNNGRPSKVGWWSDGKRTGQWELYDRKGAYAGSEHCEPSCSK